MLESWDSQVVAGTAEDVRTLALHVLAYAGFQKSYPFKSIAEEHGAEPPSSYRDSLSLILRNVLIIMVVPEIIFSVPFLPRKWAKIGWAIKEFKNYMLYIVAEEKRLLEEGNQGTGNLVSNLVRASQPNPAKPSAANKDRAVGKLDEVKPLSVQEILGNIFVFNFAGHDTTAISMAYSMYLLVAHPEVQSWISEEIQHVCSDQDQAAWNYDETFPKLQRCLAVLVCLCEYPMDVALCLSLKPLRSSHTC